MGVDQFDVASIEEIKAIRKYSQTAKCSYMHTVKSRESIKEAYFKYEIKTFSLDTKDELINSISDGLYCKSMGGGSVGATGQFNFAVEEGYLIKNGKLTKPVKGATLIGDAKEVMPKISMCGNDLELAPGFCGSVSGSVNVTVGQPHIKVDSITVGGR